MTAHLKVALGGPEQRVSAAISSREVLVMAHERRGGFTVIARPIGEPGALEPNLFGELLRRVPLCNCFVEQREGLIEIAERDSRVATVIQGLTDDL